MSGRARVAWVHNFPADAPRDFTQGSLESQKKEVWRFKITKELFPSLPFYQLFFGKCFSFHLATTTLLTWSVLRSSSVKMLSSCRSQTVTSNRP